MWRRGQDGSGEPWARTGKKEETGLYQQRTGEDVAYSIVEFGLVRRIVLMKT